MQRGAAWSGVTGRFPRPLPVLSPVPGTPRWGGGAETQPQTPVWALARPPSALSADKASRSPHKPCPPLGGLRLPRLLYEGRLGPGSQPPAEQPRHPTPIMQRGPSGERPARPSAGPLHHQTQTKPPVSQETPVLQPILSCTPVLVALPLDGKLGVTQDTGEQRPAAQPCDPRG